MNRENSLNYKRIETAIRYIKANFKEQPSLEEIAQQVHLSSFHFQRMFKEWAGISPKKFLQFISTNYAKKLLQEEKATLAKTSFETGLSGASRLHDLFINIEGMTPAEYKNEGEHLVIHYQYADSPFGGVLVASTTKGVCHMAFFDKQEEAFQVLKNKFPKAKYHQEMDSHQQQALKIFTKNWQELPEVKLHLQGTPFQLKVWEALLQIPPGRVSTYGSIAQQINNPKATRAVGTAIGQNPIAYLIPCHRVIRSTGTLGGYHWGTSRKTAIIGWEAAQLSLRS